MNESIQGKLRNLLSKIRGQPYIDEKRLNEIIRELQKILLQADVNVKIVFELSNRIRDRVRKEYSESKVPLKDLLIKILYEELVGILGGEKTQLPIQTNGLNTMLFVGLEGSGKTTTVAKLAKILGKQGYGVGVVSLDIYRPAAAEQLKQLIEQIDDKNVTYLDPKEKRDVLKRLLTAITEAKNSGLNVLLIDTAGRHHNEEELLNELSNIRKVVEPTFTILVIDSYMGQKAFDHAKALSDRVRIDGIIVTKMDGSAKAGGALSAAYSSGGKVIYIGTGEKIDDIEEYDPKSYVSRLLGIGDLEGLLKRVDRLLRKSDEHELLKKLSRGKLTLIDVVEQLERVEQMGGLYKILSYLPGFGDKVSREEIEAMENKIKRWKVAIDSMTLEEKLNPTIIKGSRLTRVSRGAGVDEKTVKDLIKQYNLMRKAFRDRKHRRMLKNIFK